MTARLSMLPGLTVYPSQGNFVYVRLPVGVDGAALRDRLLTGHGVLVRECGNKVGSSSRFLRLVVRPPQEVGQLVTALGQVLYGGPVHPVPVPAPPLAAAQAGAGAGTPVAGVPHGLQLVPASAPVPVQTPTPAQAQAPARMPAAAAAAVPVVGPMAMARGYTSSGTPAVDRLVSG